MEEFRAQVNQSMSVLAFIHVDLHGTRRQIPAPVATFGCHKPAIYSASLVHVEPATAFPLIQNAAALRGKIAVVQRGDCSFAAKAKSIQAAGAIAMILTNSNEELVRMGEAFEREGAGVDIPVLMVGQSLGNSFQNDTNLAIYIKHEPKSILQAGVDAVKKTVEQTSEAMQAGVDVVKKSVEVYTKDPEVVHLATTLIDNIVKPKPTSESAITNPSTPLFAFVLYSTNAEEFHMQFAPLADFGLSRKKLYFRSRLVFSNPIQAHPSLVNKGAFAGSIAFVERGGCTFPEKIDRLQQAGAIAVIVANNDAANPDAAFVMSVDQVSVEHITIPSVMLPHSISQRIKSNPPETLGIVCLEGIAAGVLLAQETSVYSLWTPPPSSSLPPLLSAARNGAISSLAILLETTSSHEVDAYNASALHHACISGSVEAVELLLAAGAHVDALDLGSQTPLHYACMAPNVACVQALVTAAAHTLAVNEGGSTPLHVACFAGSTECMEVLLTATATIDANGKYTFHGANEIDKSGRTPLHVACRYGHGDCAMYLMAANAEVNFVDHKGWTPLHYACDRLNSGENTKTKLHVIEQLLRYGARMQDTKATNETALILDRIHSNTLRREVEILYLRQEVANQRDSASKWQYELQRMQVTMQQAVTNAKLEAASVTAELESTLAKQQATVHHMQYQLTSVLQILQSGNSTSTCTLPPVETSPDSACSDIERAQEAALARDLGRKCMRSKQYALAKIHFETSLKWYGLPGVCRLLEQVGRLLITADTATTPSPSTLIEEYRSKLLNSGASDEVIKAVEMELASLKNGDPSSSQYTMVKEWLEWLIGLPWQDQIPCSFALFQRVNQVQIDEVQEKKESAARIIQHAIRERISSHLFQRQWAASIIQSVVRGWIERKHQQDPKQLQVYSDVPETQVELEDASDVEIVNYSTTSDPAMSKYLSSPLIVVHRGIQLQQDKTFKFYILQWIELADARHFVWTRWGISGQSNGKETALKGPYDSSSDAQSEFDKLFKLKTHQSWNASSLDNETQTPWTYYPTRYDAGPEVA